MGIPLELSRVPAEPFTAKKISLCTAVLPLRREARFCLRGGVEVHMLDMVAKICGQWSPGLINVGSFQELAFYCSY